MTSRPSLLLTIAAGSLLWPAGVQSQMVRRAQPAPSSSAQAVDPNAALLPPGVAGVPASAGLGYPGVSQNGFPIAPTAVDPNRKLRMGDQLLIRIEQDNEPPVQLVVGSSGEVVVEPLEQGVRVVDMTVPEAQAEIKRRLEKDYYYQATVRLTLTRADNTTSLGRVYISGSINRIGEIPMSADRPLTLSQAVSVAGGLSRFADQRHVQVTRQTGAGRPPNVFEVDLKEVMQKGRTDKDVVLRDGDQIFVRETYIKF